MHGVRERLHERDERVDVLLVVDVRGGHLCEHGRLGVKRQAVHGVRCGDIYLQHQPTLMHDLVELRRGHVREHGRLGVKRQAVHRVWRGDLHVKRRPVGVFELVFMRGRHIRQRGRHGGQRQAVHSMRCRAIFRRHERIDMPCVVDVW